METNKPKKKPNRCIIQIKENLIIDQRQCVNKSNKQGQLFSRVDPRLVSWCHVPWCHKGGGGGCGGMKMKRQKTCVQSGLSVRRAEDSDERRRASEKHLRFQFNPPKLLLHHRDSEGLLCKSMRWQVQERVCVCVHVCIRARCRALKGTEEVKSLAGILNSEWLMNCIRLQTWAPSRLPLYPHD